MSIAQQIDQLKKRVHEAEETAGRAPNTVQILAVSKQQTTEAIIKAYHAGIHHFGENYLQEALVKIKTLANYPLCWHFIGSIQKNKARLIAQNFSWVHSVTSTTVAQKLNDARPPHLPRLQVCIQVNLEQEDSKAGINPEEVLPLASFITTQPHLQLRGFMLIPQPKSPERQAAVFMQLADLLRKTNITQRLGLDTLSMGMSHDFAVAIAAGSTWIRIGQFIFGERKK